MIQYKLDDSRNRGILQNTTPFILDNEKEIEIFFYKCNGKLLGNGYYANIKDSLNQSNCLKIVNSKITLPRKLYSEQVLSLTVELVDNKKITRLYNCDSLNISFYGNLQKMALTVGSDINSLNCAVLDLKNGISELVLEKQNMKATIIEQAQQITELQDTYNTALILINDLLERLQVLENN